METRLYAKMTELGGMEIPLNPPAGGSSNVRLRERACERAADFPAPLIVDDPINQNSR